MTWLNILQKTSVFLPISGLTLAVQGFIAWFYPENPIGYDFLLFCSHLFLFELITMHASIFLLGRDAIFKNKIAKISFSFFLIFAYSLFIIPSALKYPWIGWNYICFALLRIFSIEEKPWYLQHAIFNKIALSDLKFIQAMVFLVKTFCFALVLPIAVYALPLPAGGLTEEFLEAFKQLHPPGSEDIYGLSLTTKSLTIYFFGIFLFDCYLFYKKPKV